MHFAVPARPFMERNAHVFLAPRSTNSMAREGEQDMCVYFV